MELKFSYNNINGNIKLKKKNWENYTNNHFFKKETKQTYICRSCETVLLFFIVVSEEL